MFAKEAEVKLETAIEDDASAPAPASPAPEEGVIEASDELEAVAEAAETEEAAAAEGVAPEAQVGDEAEATVEVAETEEAAAAEGVAPEAQVPDEAEAKAEAAEIEEPAAVEAEEDAPEAQVDGEAEATAKVAEAEEETGEAETVPDETVEEAEEPEPQDDRAWYVIHCYSGYESKVKHNLEQRTETMQMLDRIFQVVVPTEDEIEVRDGKRRTVERRVFPGYILVQMILDEDSWYVVRNTPGVTGFVGMGNQPTPLRPEEVQSIMKRMEAEAPKIRVTFKSGQKVRIVDGPFNEFIGVVDEIDMGRAKVRVLVSFFGRDTPVELDFLQVEKT
jgi:transcriptional antiterminator NusG